MLINYTKRILRFTAQKIPGLPLSMRLTWNVMVVIHKVFKLEY